MSNRIARKHHRRPPDTLDLIGALAHAINGAADRALDRDLPTSGVLYSLVETLASWISGLRTNRTINPYDVGERVLPSARTLTKALDTNSDRPPTTEPHQVAPADLNHAVDFHLAIDRAIERAFEQGLHTPQVLYTLIGILREWLDGIAALRARASLDAPPFQSDRDHTTPDEPESTQTLH